MYSNIKKSYSVKELFVKYEPHIWNSNTIQNSHNCYSYMLNDINDDLVQIYSDEDIEDRKILNPQPGHYCGMTKFVNYYETTCDNIIKRVLCDNPNITFHQELPECKSNFYRGALAVHKHDMYHFYRQDDNNYWSHKDGGGIITNLDNSNHIIIDPKDADRGEYNEFCGYFCIPENDFKNTNMARNRYRDNQLWYKS